MHFRVIRPRSERTLQRFDRQISALPLQITNREVIPRLGVRFVRCDEFAEDLLGLFEGSLFEGSEAFLKEFMGGHNFGVTLFDCSLNRELDVDQCMVSQIGGNCKTIQAGLTWEKYCFSAVSVHV